MKTYKSARIRQKAAHRAEEKKYKEAEKYNYTEQNKLP